ncbi:MAG TPA: cyclase family protein [Vicinamibacteria bacterium]|nr:cyclase family protein [Vicinamibacteria bacterium]
MGPLRLFICFLFVAGPAATQEPWWPSEWGPDDERGASNRVTADRVLEAARLIVRGKIYPLGRVYELGMPMFGNRHFSLTIPGRPTGGPFGENQLVYNDEMVSGEIGQVGTQFDGLGHVGTRINGEDVFYNGFKNIGGTYGLEKLGVQNAGPFFTRGVLLDVARAKGVDRLSPGYIISVADIEETLEREGIELREGDVVLFRTGNGPLWMTDNEAYTASNPGPGVSAIRWLVEKKIVMTGADTSNVEAVPGENPDMAFEGHQWLMNRSGVHNLENLDLEELAADEVYEFAFIFAPVPLKGATGSPGNPIAVR